MKIKNNIDDETITNTDILQKTHKIKGKGILIQMATFPADFIIPIDDLCKITKSNKHDFNKELQYLIDNECIKYEEERYISITYK